MTRILIQSMNMMGTSISYLIGPLVVPFNNSLIDDSLYLTPDEENAEKESIRKHIQNYMIVDAVMASVLLLAILIYFPSKPKTAPSPSAVLPRSEFRPAIKAMVRNPQLWLTCLAYAISNGFLAGWQGVMALNFQPLGVSDEDIGFLGFLSILVQCAVAVSVSFVQDRFRDKIKISIITLLTLASVMFLWLALLCLEVIPYALWQIYVATIAGSTLCYTIIPLSFEYAIMQAYPVSEGMVGSFLSGVFNFFVLIFLLLFFIPGIGYRWMNYLLVIGSVVSIPLIAITRTPRDFTVREEDHA